MKTKEAQDHEKGAAQKNKKQGRCSATSDKQFKGFGSVAKAPQGTKRGEQNPPRQNPKHTTRAPKHNTKPQAKPKHNTRAPKHTKPQGNPKQTQGKEATTKELGVSATHPEQSRRYIIINVSKK